MNPDPSPKRKMSEMISEMAVYFISVGKTAEEKQSRLTAACSIDRNHSHLARTPSPRFLLMKLFICAEGFGKVFSKLS